METNTSLFHSNALEYLSVEQVRDIHGAALEILADCGIVITAYNLLQIVTSTKSILLKTALRYRHEKG